MELAPGAWKHAAVPGMLAVPLFVVSPLAGVAGVALALFVLAFFRDPERSPSVDVGENDVLAAADGTVSVVRTETDDDGRNRVRVGVFMNVTDVHVNRAPLAGTVESVEHVPGGHLPAFSKRAERNERLHIDVAAAPAPRTDEADTDAAAADAADATDATDANDAIDASDGENRFRVTLIAGTVARRCHGYVEPGDAVDRGDRIGHIAFSSRVDVVLPPRFEESDVVVEDGDTVRAGRTLLARDPEST